MQRGHDEPHGIVLFPELWIMIIGYIDDDTCSKLRCSTVSKIWYTHIFHNITSIDATAIRRYTNYVYANSEPERSIIPYKEILYAKWNGFLSKLTHLKEIKQNIYGECGLAELY